VFGLVFIGRVLMRRTDGLRTLALAYLVPFAALVAWRYATFGDFVPNTFHAKTGLSPYVPLRGLVYAAYFALFYVLPWAPLLWLGRRAPRGPWTLFATLAAGWTLYVIACGGDYMAMARFFVPILPLLALAIGAAFAAARPVPARIALFGLGAAITLVHSTPLDTRLFGHPRAQMGNYAGVVNERNMVARWSSVGRWLKEYRSDPDEEVASWVVGAIGWDADMRVLDMFGLNDRHIAAAGGGLKPLGLGLPGHERRDLDYVAARRPTYVLIEIDEAPRHVSYPDWGSPRANAIVNGEYAIRQARIAQAGGDTLHVYFLERTETLARRHSS
jgi:hypothetical protein